MLQGMQKKVAKKEPMLTSTPSNDQENSVFVAHQVVQERWLDL